MVQLVVNNGTQNGVINSKATSSRATHPTALRADEVIVISYNTAAYIIKGQGNGHGAERQMGKRKENRVHMYPLVVMTNVTWYKHQRCTTLSGGIFCLGKLKLHCACSRASS